MGKPVGPITIPKNRLDSIELLAPQIGLGPAMLQALPENRPLGALRKLMVELEMLDLVAAQDSFDNSRVPFRQHIAKSEKLFVIRQSACHRFAVFAHMALVAVRGDPQRAAFYRFDDEPAHLLNFFGRCLALHRLLAHDVMPDGDMSYQPADIHSDLTFKVIQVFTVTVPGPFHALLQRKSRDRLDPHKAFHQRVLVARLYRSQRQTAVTHDYRGDAMLGFAGPVGVPEELGVQVSVMVDEARRDRQAIGVDGFRGASF